MIFDGLELINEEFTCDFARPDQMDALWANGWRHFGPHFFRYNFAIHEGDIRRVMPLRIRLADHDLSKSQRRNLARNAGLTLETRPLRITDEAHLLFQRHITRFDHGVPETLNDFVPDHAAAAPCDTRQFSVFDGDGRLVAESYFDVGDDAVSGIYGMFEPARERDGLGIFTLLKEIEFARTEGKRYYYLGYAYDGPSFYDYKKRFRATEVYDWCNGWSEFTESN